MTNRVLGQKKVLSETQRIAMVQDIPCALQCNNSVSLVILDLSKALSLTKLFIKDCLPNLIIIMMEFIKGPLHSPKENRGLYAKEHCVLHTQSCKIRTLDSVDKY